MPTTSDPLIQIKDPTGKVIYDYTPLPHQWAYHTAEAPNVIMEGGRGTGKSLAIRNDAHFRALRYPGFKYLIIRRTMPELRKSHLAYIDHEMRCFQGYYNKTENIAYYPNGSRGFFGHCENESDILNYLSAEFDLIAFDELTTFALNQFLQISSSARSTEDKPYVALVRGGTNPLGEGSQWVREWFIDKSVDPAEFPDYHPDDFQALRSVYTDNPHLNQSAYRQRLASLPSHVRKAWLDGEWLNEEGYFSDWQPWKSEPDQEPQEWHVINRLPLVKNEPLLNQSWLNVYRAVDYGYHPDPAVCLWIAILPNKRAIVLKERTWFQTTATEVARDIVRESQGMRIVDTFADPSMWIDGHRTGMSVADYYEANGVPLTPSKNDRRAIGIAIHEWLNTLIDGEPKLQVYREGCPSILRTFPQMRADKSDPVRIADGDDHWVISLGYFCLSDIAPSREPHSPGDVPFWMRKPASKTRRQYAIA